MKFISFNIKCFVFELYLVEYRSKEELQINASVLHSVPTIGVALM